MIFCEGELDEDRMYAVLEGVVEIVRDIRLLADRVRLSLES